MQIVEVTLMQVKTTKNTVRYDAPDGEFENAAVSSVYVAKSAFKELGRFPETITITVEAD